MKITRRRFQSCVAGLIPAYSLAQTPSDTPQLAISAGPFQASRTSLSAYQVPDWFRNAKFGIWAHWGPQSAVEAGDWYARNMYMQGSPQYNYHVQTYGHPSKFGFKDTIPHWKAEKFQPEELISLYKKAGARYFVSMGVHHDNFDLWNSKYQRWNAANMGPKIDIVGRWEKAARSQGLRFGISEHLWITYKWFSVSHGHDKTGPLAGVPYDGAETAPDLYVKSDEIFSKLDWNESNIPDWWKQHWFDRMKDLLDKYQPDLLYTDGALPFEERGLSIVAHLYNLSAKKYGGTTQAVYNSKRLEDGEQGLCVLDRERGVVDRIWPQPWQTDTCIGDWHYKRGATYKTPKRVIDLLVDIVSRNGNLLLNFPLPASGYLDEEELTVLAGITDWMTVNGEAIYDTRPWKTFGSGPGSAASEGNGFNENKRTDLTAADLRYTTKDSILYAFAMGKPDYKVVFHELALNNEYRVNKIEQVELLGIAAPVQWTQDDRGLAVILPAGAEKLANSWVFRVRGALA